MTTRLSLSLKFKHQDQLFQIFDDEELGLHKAKQIASPIFAQYSPIKESTSKLDQAVFLAQDAKGNYVGALSVDIDPATKTVHINNIAVANTHLRKGIGTSLIAVLIEKVQRTALEKIQANTTLNQMRAIAFFRNLPIKFLREIGNVKSIEDDKNFSITYNIKPLQKQKKAGESKIIERKIENKSCLDLCTDVLLTPMTAIIILLCPIRTYVTNPHKKKDTCFITTAKIALYTFYFFVAIPGFILGSITARCSRSIQKKNAWETA